MAVYYYARVSTDGQDLELQLNDARENGVQEGNIVKEFESAKNIIGRPIFIELVYTRLKKGDTLLFWKIDRVIRSSHDMHNLFEYFREMGIGYRCTTQAMINSGKQDYMGKLLISILGAFAEFERNVISDRTKAGMKAAALKGTKSGRPIGRPRKEINEKSKRYL